MKPQLCPKEAWQESCLRHHEPRRWMERAWRDWLTALRHANNRTLRLAGKSGSGKSAFCAWIAANHPQVAPVFCGSEIAGIRPASQIQSGTAARDAAQVLEWLARSATLALPELEPILDEALTHCGGETNPDFLADSLLLAPLRQYDQTLDHSAEARSRDLILLVDAIEECEDGTGTNPLTLSLQRIAPLLPEWVRLVVSGRSEDLNFDSVLLDLDDPSRREEDESRLSAFLERRLTHTSGITPDTALPLLLDACRGDWRCADALCAGLEGAPGPNLPEGFLDTVPATLARAFATTLDRIPQARLRDTVAPLLETLLASRRELSIPDLATLGVGAPDRSLLPGILATGTTAVRFANRFVPIWLRASRRIDPSPGHRRFLDACPHPGADSPWNRDRWWHLLQLGDLRGLHAHLIDPAVVARMFWRHRRDYLHAWRTLDAAHLPGLYGFDALPERLEEHAAQQRIDGLEPDPLLLGVLGALWLERNDGTAARAWIEDACDHLPEHMDPLDRARLLDVRGDVMIHCRFDDADPRVEWGDGLHRTALVLRLLNGDETPELADSMNNTGHAASLSGDLDTGERTYTAALDLRRRILSDTDPDLAESLQNLGFVAWRRGKLAQAESRFLEALDILSHHPVGTSCEPAVRANYAIFLDALPDREVDAARQRFLLFLACAASRGTLDALARRHAHLAAERSVDASIAHDRDSMLAAARDWLPTSISVRSREWLLFRFLMLRHFEDRSVDALEALRRDVVRWDRPDSTLAAEITSALSLLQATTDPLRSLVLNEHALDLWCVSFPAWHHLPSASLHSLLLHWALNPSFHSLDEFDRLLKRHGPSALDVPYMAARTNVERYEIMMLALMVARERRKDIPLMLDWARRIVSELGPEPTWTAPWNPDRRYAIVAIAHNEIGFHKHLPDQNYEEAEREFEIAWKLACLNMRENDPNVPNIRLNLELARSRANLEVDLDLVRQLGRTLTAQSDARAWKAREILQSHGEEQSP